MRTNTTRKESRCCPHVPDASLDNHRRLVAKSLGCLSRGSEFL
jgi:hypothetical protein